RGLQRGRGPAKRRKVQRKKMEERESSQRLPSVPEDFAPEEELSSDVESESEACLSSSHMPTMAELKRLALSEVQSIEDERARSCTSELKEMKLRWDALADIVRASDAKVEQALRVVSLRVKRLRTHAEGLYAVDDALRRLPAGASRAEAEGTGAEDRRRGDSGSSDRSCSSHGVSSATADEGYDIGSFNTPFSTPPPPPPLPEYAAARGRKVLAAVPVPAPTPATTPHADGGCYLGRVPMTSAEPRDQPKHETAAKMARAADRLADAIEDECLKKDLKACPRLIVSGRASSMAEEGIRLLQRGHAADTRALRAFSAYQEAVRRDREGERAGSGGSDGGSSGGGGGSGSGGWRSGGRGGLSNGWGSGGDSAGGSNGASGTGDISAICCADASFGGERLFGEMWLADVHYRMAATRQAEEWGTSSRRMRELCEQMKALELRRRVDTHRLLLRLVGSSTAGQSSPQLASLPPHEREALAALQAVHLAPGALEHDLRGRSGSDVDVRRRPSRSP
ncbi:unnamed protein product, partial [Phaeothamnion confervicola]